jgi:hypothetical protein
MNHLTQLITRSAAAAALLATSLAAQAVVESGHWDYGPSFNGTSALSVYQNTAHTNSYGVRTTYDAQTGMLSLGVPTLGAPASLFLVTPGQVIGQDNWRSLSSNALPVLVSPSLLVGKDFYLGTATIALTDPEFDWTTVDTTRTSFGWAHFQAQADGTLKLLDSAMAFREPGIKVGTLQAVPEPGTWALMGLGLASVAAMSRRRQR